MSSYIKNTVNYMKTDIFNKISNKDMKDFSLDNSGKYISYQSMSITIYKRILTKDGITNRYTK